MKCPPTKRDRILPVKERDSASRGLGGPSARCPWRVPADIKHDALSKQEKPVAPSLPPSPPKAAPLGTGSEPYINMAAGVDGRTSSLYLTRAPGAASPSPSPSRRPLPLVLSPAVRLSTPVSVSTYTARRLVFIHASLPRLDIGPGQRAHALAASSHTASDNPLAPTPQ